MLSVKSREQDTKELKTSWVNGEETDKMGRHEKRELWRAVWNLCGKLVQMLSCEWLKFKAKGVNMIVTVNLQSSGIKIAWRDCENNNWR